MIESLNFDNIIKENTLMATKIEGLFFVNLTKNVIPIEFIKNLEKSYQYLKKQCGSYFIHDYCVVFTQDAPIAGIMQSGKDSSIQLQSVFWEIGKPQGLNLWFFAHEVVEYMVLHHFGTHTPRWVFETLAQLGGWKTCHQLGNALELDGERWNAERKILDFKDLLTWTRPIIRIAEMTPEAIEKALSLVQEFAVGEHASEYEGNQYTTALAFGRTYIPSDVTIEEILDTLVRSSSRTWFQAFQQIGNSHEIPLG
jgi:hypothetical protein